MDAASNYPLYLSGLAWVGTAGLAWTLRRQPAPSLPWAWPALYGLSRALLAGLALLASPLGQTTWMASVEMAMVLPAGILAWFIAKQTVAMPCGRPRTALRLAAGLIVAEACLEAMSGVWAQITPLAALCAVGVVAAIGYYRVEIGRPGPLRRWAEPAAFVLLALAGWPLFDAAPRDNVPATAGVVAQHGTGPAERGDPQGINIWDRAAGQRWREVLLVLGLFLVLVVGLAAAYRVQSRPVRRRYLPSKCSSTASSRPS